MAFTVQQSAAPDSGHCAVLTGECYRCHLDESTAMAHNGRPIKYDPAADAINRSIRNNKDRLAKELIAKLGSEILDGDGRTPLIEASFSNNLNMLE